MCSSRRCLRQSFRGAGRVFGAVILEQEETSPREKIRKRLGEKNVIVDAELLNTAIDAGNVVNEQPR
jgi:hypothetical protein